MATTIDVRDAVIGALGKAFPGTVIYAEEIKQGFVAPCFFVKDLPFAHSRVMGKRYARAHGFDVHYFPASTSETKAEALGVAERLTEVLEYMPMGDGIVRATGMHSELVDDVLHFIFEVTVQLIKHAAPAPLMELATIKELIKSGKEEY